MAVTSKRTASRGSQNPRSQAGPSIPLPHQYLYTDSTPEERDRNITRPYMGTLPSILGLAYFIGFVGICYQLTGQMATEREIGMSGLTG